MDYEKLLTTIKRSLSGVLPCHLVGRIAERVADAFVVERVSVRGNEEYMKSTDEIIKTLEEKLELTINLLGDDADKDVLVTVDDIKNTLDLINRQKKVISLATQEIVDLKTKVREQKAKIEDMQKDNVVLDALVKARWGD